MRRLLLLLLVATMMGAVSSFETYHKEQSESYRTRFRLGPYR